MLSTAYLAGSYRDTETVLTHAHTQIGGTIVADIDNNGFVDIVTFPSNYIFSAPLKPIVWTNNKGVFSYNPTVIADTQAYQFFRDSVAGDFNGDGYQDYIQVDQGWELDNRTNNVLGQVSQLVGTQNGLVWKQASEFLDNRAASTKTFNHISDAADYDGDGDIDVAIASFFDYRLYKNNGAGRFTWEEIAVPSSSSDASGTTFIKLGQQYAIVNGFYRIWDEGMTSKPLMVMTQTAGVFSEAYTLARPDLGGRERNYGASDMFNQDLNGDGREDLIVLWETEPSKGIDDGQSNMTGSGPRYTDIPNVVANVYFQDALGKLVRDDQIIKFDPKCAGQIALMDFNRDGYMDFYNYTWGVDPQHFDKVVWINDGTGHFSNPKAPMFSINDKTIYDGMSVSPWFTDIDNDGDIDVAGTTSLGDPDTYMYKSVGQELYLWINQEKAPGKTFVGTKGNDTIVGTDGNDIINGKLGQDYLTGGDGADTFVFDTNLSVQKVGKKGGFFGFLARKKIVTVDQSDTITDFDPSKDTLKLDSKIFTKFADDKNWEDNVAIGFANQDNDDWLVYDDGRIFYDTNGNLFGFGNLVVTLVGSPQLTPDNLIIA